MYLQNANYMPPTPNPDDYSLRGTAEADKSLLVKFFIKPRQDMEKTQTEGRPVFKDVEYIDIKIPGNRNAGACRPATEADKNRFPDHYRRFKERVSDADLVVGTPLAEWPLITRSLAEELSFFHVKTVEQLAGMADAQAARFMGLMPIKQRAIKWLENVAKEKPMWEMDQKIRAQQQQIEELQTSLARVLSLQHDADEPEGEELNDKQRARIKKDAVKALEGK